MIDYHCVSREHIESLTTLIIETINKVGIDKVDEVKVTWNNHRISDRCADIQSAIAPDVTVKLKEHS